MNEHKEFTLAVKRVAGIKVAGCEDCGLDSLYPNIVSCHTQDCDLHMECIKPCDTHTPCPTCAPLRELEKGLCTEEDKFDKWDEHTPCSNCGLTHHASQKQWYIQSIRAMLESLGHRVGFIKWNHRQCDVHFSYKCGELWVSESDIAWDIMVEASAEILTSDPLMLKAAIEFLKGVE